MTKFKEGDTVIATNDIIDDEFGFAFARSGDELIVVNFVGANDDELSVLVRLPINNSEAFLVCRNEIRKADQQ